MLTDVFDAGTYEVNPTANMTLYCGQVFDPLPKCFWHDPQNHFFPHTYFNKVQIVT